MSWFGRSGLRGLLVAPLLGAATAQTVTTPPTAAVTAVSSCHLHGTAQYCEAGTVEYLISGAATTASSYTDCHLHDGQTLCLAPTGEVQIILAAETGHSITRTPAPAPSPTGRVTAVSECHLHGSEVYCMAGTTEYVVHTPATGTVDVPPAFTGCHAHDAETFCVAPNGDDVKISLAAEEDDHGDDHEEETSGLNCHFHAGVEHCTGGNGERVRTCEKVDRDYNIGLRVGLLFVILVTSSIGVFTPIFAWKFVSPNSLVFTILRQFGTGIIISTAFIHLFTHATLMFANECLGELAYEGTAAAILMAGLFLSFLVEYLGIRLVQWHGAKSAAAGLESAGGASKASHASPEMVNIAVLEAGVIFHSLLIGLTLVVAGDSTFITLFVVILFHQMFEGIALGTRIAALGQPRSADSAAHPHGHGLGHHGHFHEPKQSMPTTLAEELGAASDHQRTHAHPHDHAHAAHPRKSSGAEESDTTSQPSEACVKGHSVSMRRKLLLAAAFALVTPLGMGIGIGVLKNFNGNDPSTIVAIGTLDALSAGILVWVGVVEMWAHDWMLGGEMTTAGPLRTVLGMTGLVGGLVLMSLLGKWA
ncbi:hypothetical protein QBC34DRAFT_411574 [Podospora aff. communis PSN243]|uniref:Uncharacterized protein n=1 Tax=Podospora aff. communis PSN243 TaxID=3040156 RepID=A0AAV9GE60_9PEZI|nr:hypothetical protein QBC34DRAFT_411574 [Podospora aff. communis PSN243]